MNIDLKKFLDFIVNPESRFDTDNYIASRRISDNGLIITVGYLNGSAWISGIAFRQLIKIRFNHFENNGGFYTTVNGLEMRLPLTEANIRSFFETGKFLQGTYYKDGSMAWERTVEDMNYYLWEAVLVGAQTLRSLKLMFDDLDNEIMNINKEIAEGSHFSDELKARACKVDFEISKFQSQLNRHYEAEDKNRI